VGAASKSLQTKCFRCLLCCKSTTTLGMHRNALHGLRTLHPARHQR
jgi:hypothetical protein